jgi:hypothetical protein
MDFGDISIVIFSLISANRAPPQLARHLQSQLLIREPTDPLQVAGAVWGLTYLGHLSNKLLPLILQFLQVTELMEFQVPVIYNAEQEEDILDSFTATALV